MSISITIDNVIDALADFIEPFVSGAEIVRAQVNRVPMPHDSCVVLTELLQVDLEVPTSTFDGVAQNRTMAAPKRIDIQIDFYGEDSGDLCATIKSIFRTEHATSQFSDGIKPLYCSDGIQSPLVTGEQQWEGRWTLTASLQYNPVVVVNQQSATTTTLNTVQPIDVF